MKTNCSVHSACLKNKLLAVCSFGLLSIVLSACSLTAPAPTPTALPPTDTATFTAIPATNTVTLPPSATPTQLPPSATATITLTPTDTATPTASPTASTTPYPAVAPQATAAFLGDHFTQVSIDKQVIDGIGRSWISFANINDKPSTVVPGTPAPANGIETVYITAPTGGLPIKVVDLPASVDRRVYWSPNGAYLAYFLPSGNATGLYLLDLRVGIMNRLFSLTDLNPRGILSEPVWSPDSTQITMTMATAYDVDIYSISVDGTQFRNLASSGGNDFWPVWSPDGQYVAFVSDRAQCTSWEPNAPGSCYKPDSPTPDGGNLYIIEAVSGQVRQVSDQWITAPPHWISSTRLAFTSGKPNAPDAGNTLWWADLRGGPPHRVTDANAQGNVIVRDSWSADGNRVIYQEAQTGTHIVMRDAAGKEIARSTDINFPRYDFAAEWSPDGKKVVIGGHNSQCPYGILLTDDSFATLVDSAPNPGVCDPTWSPDGLYIAFGGVTQSDTGSDGRFDVYVAQANGYGARNLSARSGGQIRFIGWVGR